MIGESEGSPGSIRKNTNKEGSPKVSKGKKSSPPRRPQDRETKDSIQFCSTRPLAWWSAPTNQF